MHLHYNYLSYSDIIPRLYVVPPFAKTAIDRLVAAKILGKSVHYWISIISIL